MRSACCSWGFFCAFILGSGCAMNSQPKVETVAATNLSGDTAPAEVKAPSGREIGTKEKPLRLEGSMVRTSGDDLVEEPVYDSVHLFFLARDATDYGYPGHHLSKRNATYSRRRQMMTRVLQSIRFQMI